MNRADYPDATSESATASALAVAPESRSPLSGLVDQAFAEFCARRDRGEAIDPDLFCARFPALQGRLGRQLHAFLFFEEALAPRQPPADTLWPQCGERFLDFQLVLELGRGAFARVYLATEPRLGGRLVALKVAWHGGAEAEILGRLQHPNVVPVHSVHAVPNTNLTAVCMPYLGSTTLSDVLDKLHARPTAPAAARFFLDVSSRLAHPLDPSAHPERPAPILRNGTYADGLRAIALQLADALVFLHERGIYHQDLKPSNVLMTPAGTPMLLDFNLCADARATSLLGGTLPYMAPELLQGQDESSATLAADARSDIFSLGVILFELATGAHPFGTIPPKLAVAQTRGMLLERMRHGAPDAGGLNPAIEKSLGQLIGRCLARNPHDRPESAAEIAAALRLQLRPAARARRFFGRHPKSMAAAFCLLVGIGVAAAAFDAARPPLAKRQFDAGLQFQQQGQFDQAIAQFSAVLEADPHNVEALRARGRAFQGMGGAKKEYYQTALIDYHKADELAPDARTKASIGYCQNLTGKVIPVHLIETYQQARMLGCETAGLFNNLGFSQMRNDQFGDAEKSLDRAIELDRGLQAAYHNRALVRLQKALVPLRAKATEDERKKRHQEDVKSVQAGMADIVRAIELGPPSAELYFDAARLHGRAAQDAPAHKKAVLNYLQEAIARNFDARRLLTDPCFSALAKDDAFKKLAQTPPPAQTPPRAVRIVDPVKDMPH
jgi:serine/threonine protein kinase/Tfp pilus assembly protein PilF